MNPEFHPVAESSGGSRNDALPVTITAAAAEWVSRRDAGFSSAEETEFQSWLEADPRHRAALERYASAWATLDRPAQAGASEDFLEALNVLDQRRRHRWIFSIAATAALMMSAIAVWNFSPQRDSDPATAVATARLVSPSQQILPDGSVVDLKDGAEIHVNFSPALRQVTLRRGEAHFEVKKDSARPFVVSAGGVEVRAVGTAFAVQLGQSAVEVHVTEGRVRVQKPSSEPSPVVIASGHPKASADEAIEMAKIVTAGERATIGLTTLVPEVAEVPAPEMAERLSWRAPRLEFSGTSLTEAIELLNHYAATRHNVRFVIADAEIAQIRISGLFRADNTAAFVDLLENGFGIKSTPRGESVLLLERER